MTDDCFPFLQFDDQRVTYILDNVFFLVGTFPCEFSSSHDAHGLPAYPH